MDVSELEVLDMAILWPIGNDNIVLQYHTITTSI